MDYNIYIMESTHSNKSNHLVRHDGIRNTANTKYQQ